MSPQLYTKLGHTKLTQFVETLRKTTKKVLNIALIVVINHICCGAEIYVPTTVNVPST